MNQRTGKQSLFFFVFKKDFYLIDFLVGMSDAAGVVIDIPLQNFGAGFEIICDENEICVRVNGDLTFNPREHIIDNIPIKSISNLGAKQLSPTASRPEPRREGWGCRGQIDIRPSRPY